MAKREYDILDQNCSEAGEEETGHLLFSKSQVERRWKSLALIFGSILIFSIAANVIFVYRLYVRPWRLLDVTPTKYAGLTRTTPLQAVLDNKYESVDRTIQDTAWNATDLQEYHGFLALDESYAIQQNLPHSQRWVWDLSKGVYILRSSHEIHCLSVLRSSINDAYDGLPQTQHTWPYSHVMHCLNSLRETVMCNADDTPLRVGHSHDDGQPDHERANLRGDGRKCRDWKALVAWSQARSACYRPVHRFDKDYPELERYKHCPDGARPWETWVVETV